MAGVKGRSGGARRGAGAPPKFHPVQMDDLHRPANMSKNDMLEAKLSVPYGNGEKMLCPKEFKEILYAKKEWQRILKLDRELRLLNTRHYEALKSYCIAVARRQECIDQWIQSGKPATFINDRGEIKDHPLVKQIDKLADQINGLASDLYLTPISEAKRGIAKQKINDQDENLD